MAVVRWREPRQSGAIIHCDGPDGNDYTLCGYATEGECGDAESGGAECEEVSRGKIDCERCIAIIRFAKAVPARMLRP